MPTFSRSVTFTSFTKIKAADHNSNMAAIETFLNTTKIDDANIQGAGITRSTKLKTGTAFAPLVNDNTGAMAEVSPNTTTTRKFLRQVGDGVNATASVLDTVNAQDVINGAGSRAAAFDLLSPNSVKGDITVFSTTNAKLGVGSDGQVLTADSTQSQGVKWATPTASPTGSEEIHNLGLTTSVASNALTIALKQSDGSTDPSTGTGAVKVSFRSATSTTGGYNERSITGALSITVPNTTTLGQQSAANEYVYVYLVDDGGTVDIGVTGRALLDEGSLYACTQIGAGQLSGTTLYTTSAHTGTKPIRFIGRLAVNETIAGAWASAPTEVSLVPARKTANPTLQIFTTGSGTYTAPAGTKWIRVRMSGGGGGGNSASTGNAAAGNGGNTTFGSFLTANGGAGATTTDANIDGVGGIGGSATVSAPAFGFGLKGGDGQSTTAIAGGVGGQGGCNPLGGAGGGGLGRTGAAGTNAAANTGGGGGGGGGTGAAASGAGGGAGAYIDAVIYNPATSYSWAVGSGGAGHAGSAGTGGNGGSGLIIVEEYY